MIYDYNETLRQQLHNLQNTLGLTEVSFEVDSEQAFIKNKDLDPNTIYVLTRNLQNDNSIGVDTQPVQILILTEQNSLDIANAFFTEFAKKYNFEASSSTYTENGVSHSIWVKQQYSDPVVLSNFNTVDYGYRSVLYMAANLYIMYDIADLNYPNIDGNIKIDSVAYKVLTFDLSYSMTPNTQQLSTAGEYISKSIKSISTLAITITIPTVSSALITKVLAIMNETDTTTTDLSDSTSYGGNENFLFDFYIGTTHFESKKLKLTTAEFGAAVNNIPAIRLGFMK